MSLFTGIYENICQSIFYGVISMDLCIGHNFVILLHTNIQFKVGCNTLTGGQHVLEKPSKSKACGLVLGSTMLAIRNTCGKPQLFDQVHPTILEQGWIPQKFHPQRQMVYTSSYSHVQPRRPMVCGRNRFFQSRESDQYTYQADHKQQCGFNSRSTGPKTKHSLSHPACTTLPTWKTATGKSWPFLRLYGRRPTYCRESTPGSGWTKFDCESSTCGNSCVGVRGVHSKSRIQFRPVGDNTQNQQTSKHFPKANSKGFHPVWGKKNSANSSAGALWALKLSLERLTQEVTPAALFPTPPVVCFVPEVKRCRCCDQTLQVQKTRKKTVFAMTGPFVAHETLLICPQCFEVYSSEPLHVMVPHRCNVAFDVLIFVGRALFQRHRNLEEVQAELMARNVRICTSEIDYLGRKFITYLAIAHRQATPRIRQKMEMAGGYVLHLDATHEGSSPALMSGMDSLSEIVLSNIKIPSENADHIITFLQDIKTNYGIPTACVHDMGIGICKAVSKVFPGIRDFICHFHFLRDIGKDFLEPAYGRLRKRLRKHSTSTGLNYLARQMKQALQEQGIEGQSLTNSLKNAEIAEDSSSLPLVSAYSLTLWALHGKQIGNGYGFPFDRPLLHFAQRVLELNRTLPELLKYQPQDKNRRHLRKLAKQLSKIGQDQEFLRAIKELQWRGEIFDDLRTAMRIAPENENNGLNDDGSQESMTTIRQEVERFREDLNSKKVNDTLCQKIIQQIDKYAEKLFADPIEVNTSKGKVFIYPQRTNNIMEQFFRSIRRAQRRKTGNNSLRQMLYTMLAETPLIKNLDNPDYMEILLDGKGSLEELFASQDQNSGFANNETNDRSDRIIPGFRSVMKLQNLPNQLIELFAKKNSLTESN